MPRVNLNLKRSISTDAPVGLGPFDFKDQAAEVEQNTGIERNGGITNIYEQATTFGTAGASSKITGDGSLLQVDASHNVLLDNVSIGNVGPLAVHRRGLLAGYLDAAWTEDDTIIGITKIGTVIKVDEFNPATGAVINTRNITFAAMPTGLILNVALVKYVDMAYVDAQEFVLSSELISYHLLETGTVVSIVGTGMVWTSRTSASAVQWQSVCWSPELSLFCAVSSGGAVGVQVMTSPDGTNWTSRTSASAQQWMSVCWSPERSLFCAVAGNGAVGVQVMTSPNGITWTSRTSASAQAWQSVCWSPERSLFCAVAGNGVVAAQIMVSSDGITWVSRTSPSAQNWQSVCWSPALSLFCAVAVDGAAGVQVMTSPTGTTWTSRTSADAREWREVCWSPELSLFCAVASDGLVDVQIMTSPDGINWTSRTSPSAQQWYSVCWSPGLSMFCAVAMTGAVGVQVMTSPDGVTWTSRTSASAQWWQSVCWSPALSLFCAVAFDGLAGVQVMTSSGYIANLDTAWKFAADKYLFGRQGVASSWAIGTVAAVTSLALWKWAIINRHTGTAYSRAILTRDPTQVSTNLIGYGEVGYSSAGVWSATVTGYGPTLAAATATISNPISAPGYSECTYVRSDTGTKIYYYHAPDFSHIAVSNYANSESNTHTPINAYGKLTDLWNNINSAMVPALASLRVMMIPLSTTGGLASYLSAAPISATTTLDHIGVPITLVGEFDETFMPHVDDNASTYSRVIYRFNGNLYYVDIESGQSKRIDKLTDTVYQINTLSALNIVDTTKHTLELGVNDYNGRLVPTNNLGSIGTAHTIVGVMRSPYAGSVDPGTRSITNYIANTSASVPGIEIPTFVDRQANYGVDIYLDEEYEETYVSRYSYRIMADKTGTLYVIDTRIPIAMGYSYGQRTVQTEVSTIFTGVGVTGSTDIDYGYAGYELGNDIFGTFVSFVLYGQRYVLDDFGIYLATFDGSVYSRKEYICQAAGMVYIASSPTAIWFLSAFDNSLYTFDGGRSLTKTQRLNAEAVITDGVYSTVDNTLLLQTASTFIWVRDGIVTKNAKTASQTSTYLYDTASGIVIANDTTQWRYTFMVLSASIVVPLTWQSPYLGLNGGMRSVASEWLVGLYNAAPTAVVDVTLTCESYDEDGYASNVKTLSINPSEWSGLGMAWLRIAPKTQRCLASSVKVYTTARLVIHQVAVEWFEDESAAKVKASRSG